MTPEQHEAMRLALQFWGWLVGIAACALAMHLLTRTVRDEPPRQPQPCRHYDPTQDNDLEVRVETHA